MSSPDFRRRAAELERAHRERASLARTLERGMPSSWLYRWARSLFSSPRAAPLVAPPIPMPAAGECVVTFLGHATTLVRYTRGRVLTDPCFAGSLFSLRRARAAGLPPGALEGLDVVL